MGTDESRERTVFVSNIQEDVTEDLLLELFIQAGPVNNLKLLKNDRIMAFVEFKHEESVPYAIALLNNTCLFEKPLMLKARDGTVMAKKIAESQKQAREDEYRRRAAVHQAANSFHGQGLAQSQHIKWADSAPVYTNQQQNQGFHFNNQQNFGHLQQQPPRPFLNPLCFANGGGSGVNDGQPLTRSSTGMHFIGSYQPNAGSAGMLAPPPPPPPLFSVGQTRDAFQNGDRPWSPPFAQPNGHHHQQHYNQQQFHQNHHHHNQNQNGRYPSNKNHHDADRVQQFSGGDRPTNRSRSSNRYRK